MWTIVGIVLGIFKEFLLVGKELIDESTLGSLTSLEAISKYGVGLDNIDLDACRKKNIPVYWTPGVNATSVAEHTLALILDLMRNITLSHNRIKKGVWHKDGGRQLTGAKVAIIGCGHVGKELCRLLQSFSCKIYR